LLAGCTDATEHTHDHSVEIEGKDMKILTVREVAELWDIEPVVFLNEIIAEFELENDYTEDTVIEEMREEYKFSPALIKDIAEEIKMKSESNEQS
jgi:hypothetical protein